MKEVRVTPAEVRAAKLLVEVDEAEGRSTPEAIHRIAEAKPRSAISSETRRLLETTSEPISPRENRLLGPEPSSPRENRLLGPEPSSPRRHRLSEIASRYGLLSEKAPESGSEPSSSRRYRLTWASKKEDSESTEDKSSDEHS